MDKMTALLNFLVACISLIASIIGLIFLFKNQKNDNKSTQTNFVKNNSGIVNQYGSNYNYTDNKTYVTKTQIVYNTTPRKEALTNDTAFLVGVFLLWFPFSKILEENLWIFKTTILLVQAVVTFCIYKKVQICLPESSTFVNILFLFSPTLLIIISGLPALIGFDTVDFSDMLFASLLEKLYKTSSLLLTYPAFLLMLLSQICSLISPKVTNPALNKFLCGGGRLWKASLYFQLISVVIIFIGNFTSS